MNEKTKHNGASAPDIDSVSIDAWSRRPFPIQGRGNRNVVQVVIKRSVLRAICRHGRSRTDVEVCGVLVGDCYQDDRGPFIYVQAMIQGEHSDNKVAQVTFTSETWNYIQNEMEQRFGGLRIVGWYHTHPGFGIFLSAMDMFIHENFFGEGEQLALVYDPVGEQDGLFVWHHGKPELYQYLVEEDAAASGIPLGNKAVAGPRLTAAARSEDDDVPVRIRRLERRNRVLGWGVVATGLFALVWPIVFAGLNLSAVMRTPSSGARFQEAVPTGAHSRVEPQNGGPEARHSQRPESGDTPSAPNPEDGKAGSRLQRPVEPPASSDSAEKPAATDHPQPVNKGEAEGDSDPSESGEPSHAVNRGLDRPAEGFRRQAGPPYE